MVEKDASSKLLSKAVFGSTHMLSLMTEIAGVDSGQFSVPLLAEKTGLPPSTIHHHLARLKTAGLIQQTERGPGDRVVVFVRTENGIWTGVKDLDAKKLISR